MSLFILIAVLTAIISSISYYIGFQHGSGHWWCCDCEKRRNRNLMKGNQPS